MYLIHSKKEMEINYFLLMDDECEIKSTRMVPLQHPNYGFLHLIQQEKRTFPNQQAIDHLIEHLNLLINQQNGVLCLSPNISLIRFRSSPRDFKCLINCIRVSSAAPYNRYPPAERSGSGNKPILW